MEVEQRAAVINLEPQQEASSSSWVLCFKCQRSEATLATATKAPSDLIDDEFSNSNLHINHFEVGANTDRGKTSEVHHKQWAESCGGESKWVKERLS